MHIINDLLGLQQEDLKWYQMMVRTLIVFILALIFLRLTRMRSFGSGTAFDMVLNITLGAILAGSIIGKAPFVPCLCAAATLIVCHQIIAYTSYHSSRVRQIAEGKQVYLYKDGKFFEPDMKKHNVTHGEIRQALHAQNMDDLESVKALVLEVNGKINVVKKEE